MATFGHIDRVVDVDVSLDRGCVEFPSQERFLEDGRTVLLRDDDPFFFFGDLREEFEDSPVLKMSKNPIADLLA